MSDPAHSGPSGKPAPKMVLADPAARRRGLLIGLVLVAALAGYAAYLADQIQAFQASDPPDPSGLVSHMYWMSVVLVAAGGLLGFYLLVIGLRALRSGRFPPPGVRVIRDTRVRTGAGARVIGLVAVSLGASLPAVALVVHGLVSRFVGIAPLF